MPHQAPRRYAYCGSAAAAAVQSLTTGCLLLRSSVCAALKRTSEPSTSTGQVFQFPGKEVQAGTVQFTCMHGKCFHMLTSTAHSYLTVGILPCVQHRAKQNGALQTQQRFLSLAVSSCSSSKHVASSKFPYKSQSLHQCVTRQQTLKALVSCERKALTSCKRQHCLTVHTKNHSA